MSQILSPVFRSIRFSCRSQFLIVPVAQFFSSVTGASDIPVRKQIPRPLGRLKREGDWSCKCGHENFGSRIVCQVCGASNPNGLSPNVRVREAPVIKLGDWMCSCGCHNFASRHRCLECCAAKNAGVRKANQQT